MQKHPSSKAAVDNRANQLNPQHAAFHQSRGTPQDTAAVTADQVRAGNEANAGSAGDAKSTRDDLPESDG